MSGGTPSSAGGRRLQAYGDRGVLVEVDALADVLRLGAGLRAARSAGRLPGVVDLVPAARSVLVIAETPDVQAAVAAAVTAALNRGGDQGAEDLAAGDSGSDVAEVEVAVRYDGPDLDDVGRLTGLGARGVVEAHSSAGWVVAFAGFAPGFCYLVDADRGEQSPLAVPRRDEPRTSVPAGAVGLAGEFSGVYPRSSPGGWQLIGTTSARLWDLDRDPPALLQPGGRVRFVEAGSAGGFAEAPA